MNCSVLGMDFNFWMSLRPLVGDGIVYHEGDFLIAGKLEWDAGEVIGICVDEGIVRPLGLGFWALLDHNEERAN